MHSIRLQEPWRPIQWSDVPPALAEVATEFELANSSTLLFSRSFNRPTGLEPGQPVALCFRSSPGTCVPLAVISVWLNEFALNSWPDAVAQEQLPDELAKTEPAPVLFRADPHLEAANRLVVALDNTLIGPNDPRTSLDQQVRFTELAAASLIILE